MNSNQITEAEIVLTSASGRVVATVNGEQIATTKDSDGFIGRIEKALRAARIYRESGYSLAGGAFIAVGRIVP